MFLNDLKHGQWLMICYASYVVHDGGRSAMVMVNNGWWMVSSCLTAKVFGPDSDGPGSRCAGGAP